MANPATVGILFGMERTFPAALAEAINAKAGGKVTARPVDVGATSLDTIPSCEVILDRISQDVPFYRTYLKAAAARGAQVVNNPFWWSADDKFTDNLIAQSVGVAVPKTVLLPHRDHPPGTTAESFTNLTFPIDWSEVFSYLEFPMFLKPAYGGGWKDVYRVANPDEFFAAYSRTGSLTMILQEAIEFTEYYRCYCLDRSRVRLMRYDPKMPHEHRYVQGAPPVDRALGERINRDCLALCDALGYDFNTLEFAVRDGIPYAIDFMNPAPDADLHSVGPDNFGWVVDQASEFLMERALFPRPFEATGTWPGRLDRRRGRTGAAADSAAAPAPATVPGIDQARSPRGAPAASTRI
jgi:glutathione synthase/RimK-type ligase-like ATP-grasp enzyme